MFTLFTQPQQRSPQDGASVPPDETQEPYVISFDEFTVDEKSCKGIGNFGSVYLGKYSNTGPVVIKRFTYPSDIYTKELQEQFMQVWKITHPHLVTLYGLCTKNQNLTQDKCHIVMEYMSNGSLHNVLEAVKNDPTHPISQWSSRAKIAEDIASGLAYLHTKGKMPHRSLNSRNVLFDDSFKPKLSDAGFGKARLRARQFTQQFNRDLPKHLSSLSWTAPEETIYRYPVDWFASDIFGLGMLLWSLAALKEPHADKSDDDILDILNQLHEGSRKEPESIPDDCPEKLAEIIRACWNRDPATRPTSIQVVEQLSAWCVSMQAVEGNLLSSTSVLRP